MSGPLALRQALATASRLRRQGERVFSQQAPSTDSGRAVAKLGDFGLAVSLDMRRLTQAGMMVGTVSYMPPEQAIGGKVEARSGLGSIFCW